MFILNTLSYLLLLLLLLIYTEFYLLSGIYLIFNQTYLIEEIKYLLELKKNVIHRSKWFLAIELNFLVNANRYLFRSPERQTGFR